MARSFNAKAICPKCAHTDVSAEHHPPRREEYIYYSPEDCARIDLEDRRFAATNEHMMRKCKRCGFPWIESTIALDELRAAELAQARTGLSWMRVEESVCKLCEKPATFFNCRDKSYRCDAHSSAPSSLAITRYKGIRTEHIVAVDENGDAVLGLGEMFTDEGVNGKHHGDGHGFVSVRARAPYESIVVICRCGAGLNFPAVDVLRYLRVRQ